MAENMFGAPLPRASRVTPAIFSDKLNNVYKSEKMFFRSGRKIVSDVRFESPEHFCNMDNRRTQISFCRNVKTDKKNEEPKNM